MKTKFFLKQSYVRPEEPIWGLYAILSVICIGLAYRFDAYIKGGIFILVLTFISNKFVKELKSYGLYIDEGTLYYEGLKSMYIKPEEIAAIKVNQAYRKMAKGGSIPFEGKNGEVLYTISLLKSVDEDVERFSDGDIRFQEKHWKKIICTVVFDREAINCIKSLNSEIRILW